MGREGLAPCLEVRRESTATSPGDLAGFAGTLVHTDSSTSCARCAREQDADTRALAPSSTGAGHGAGRGMGAHTASLPLPGLSQG